MSAYHPDASNIGSTFSDLRKLHNLMRINEVRFSGTVLEIGAGWFPIAGIVARLAGADHVILTDVTPFMSQQTFLTSRQIVLDRLDRISEEFDFDPTAARRMLIAAGVPEDLKLTYRAPFDIGDVPDASLDLVMSRACLEHIPIPDLEALMDGLRRKLNPSGFMVHAIDNTDHFSHGDPTLSRVNFLTWSENKHRLIWSLAGSGENRLRHHEYADLFMRTGYEVIASDASIDDKVLQDFPRLNLSALYNQMTAEQIAALSSLYVLKIPAARAALHSEGIDGGKSDPSAAPTITGRLG